MTHPPSTPRKRIRHSLGDEAGSPTYSLKAPPAKEWSSSLHDLGDTLVNSFNDFVKVPHTHQSTLQLLEGYGRLRRTLANLTSIVDNACRSITDANPGIAHLAQTIDQPTQTDAISPPLPVTLPPPSLAHKDQPPAPPPRTFASAAAGHPACQAQPRPQPSTRKAQPPAVKPLGLKPVCIIVQLSSEPSLPILNLTPRDQFQQLTGVFQKLPDTPALLGANWNRKGNLIIAFPAGTPRNVITPLFTSIQAFTGSHNTPTIRFDTPWRKVHLAGICARDSPNLPIASEEALRETLQLNPAIQALSITVQASWLRKSDNIAGTRTSAIIAFEDPDGSVERALLKSTVYAFGETITIKKWHDQPPIRK